MMVTEGRTGTMPRTQLSNMHSPCSRAPLQNVSVWTCHVAPALSHWLRTHRGPELAHDECGAQLRVVEHDADARVRLYDIPPTLLPCERMRCFMGQATMLQLGMWDALACAG